MVPVNIILTSCSLWRPLRSSNCLPCEWFPTHKWRFNYHLYRYSTSDRYRLEKQLVPPSCLTNGVRSVISLESRGEKES